MRIPFAVRHKESRLRSGYTQKQLADLLGIPQSTIGSWESGKVGAPETPMLLRLCEVYLVSADWLLGVPDADMLHPSLRIARMRLRIHLKQNVTTGGKPIKEGITWLMTEYPDIFTVSFLCRRLKVDSEQLRSGNLPTYAVDFLVELTGVPLEFWWSGDPRLLDTPPIDSEVARLTYVLASNEITVDTIEKEITYLRSRARYYRENERG